MRDEAATFLAQTQALQGTARDRARRLDWTAGLASYKAVLLEGLEVVFVVISVGAAGHLLVPASLGALAACALIAALGAAVQRPLTRVPENALKFAVGVMLSAFGVFWVGEGLGVAWQGGDLSIPAVAAMFLAVSGLATVARRREVEI